MQDVVAAVDRLRPPPVIRQVRGEDRQPVAHIDLGAHVGAHLSLARGRELSSVRGIRAGAAPRGTSRLESRSLPSPTPSARPPSSAPFPNALADRTATCHEVEMHTTTHRRAASRWLWFA